MTHASEPPQPSRAIGRRFAIPVLSLFFLSGLTSLVYEVLWVRQFGLVFGITTYAVSTVLAAFFAGLALGSWIAGRIIDRTRLHPLAVYGVMEGAVGIYALLLPALLTLVEASYPTVYTQLAGSFALFTLFRFLICLCLLLIPTTLMGATLPVLSKLMVEREAALGTSVGRLYAVNTFGAVAGTASAGFLLIPTLGVSRTVFVAAAVNLLLALAALLMSRSPLFGAARPHRAQAVTAYPREPLTPTHSMILLIAFTSGLAFLALEVVWTRALVLILGSTTYAFSTMLTAVLAGVSAGSAVFARLADSSRNRGALVAFFLFTGGLCAVLGPAIINRLPFAFVKLYQWTRGEWSLVIITQFVVSFLLVFIPTFLSGASFPVLIRMYSRGLARVGRTVADVYAVNTLGGILGSLLAGFVLVKAFGLQPTLTAAALLLMLAGGTLAIALAHPRPIRSRASIAAAVLAAVVLLAFLHPRLDAQVLFGGWGPWVADREIISAGWAADRYTRRLLYHREGVSATVDVVETAWGRRGMSINAKPVATTSLYDMRNLRLLGHLPVLLHPDPREALVIGLGAGVSSGVIASYPAVRQVTVVELCEEVPDGTAFFAEWNYDVLSNPKVSIVFNDGANYLKATRKHYDIISSDPIHPFVSGAGTLYSYEHWQICRERLRPGGVLAQWLPLYHISRDDLATIVRTFLGVFPEATMWYCGMDTALIGTRGPLQIDPERLRRRMADPEVVDVLGELGLQQPGGLLGWFIAGPEQLRQIAGDGPRNRTGFPILEFSAPKALARPVMSANLRALLEVLQQVPPDQVSRQLNHMCAQPLDPDTLILASAGRSAAAWLIRAQLAEISNQPERSLDAALEAHALRPHDAFVRRGLSDAQQTMGRRLLDGGSPDEALRAFRQALLSNSLNAKALVGAVEAAYQVEGPDSAQQLLENADPELRHIFQVLVWSATMARLRFDRQRARLALEEAARHGQESFAMHTEFGLLALTDDKRARAYAHFDRALRIAPDRMSALFDIVKVCTGYGFPADARPYAYQLVKEATRAIARDPANPTPYRYRTLAYFVLGDEEAAERDGVRHGGLRAEGAGT